MSMHIPAAHARQMRRARAVSGALARGKPKTGLMLRELAALAVFAVAAAGIIALRAWLAVG